MKSLFIDAPSPTARFITSVVLSFFLISVDHQHRHFAALRSGLTALVYPIQYAVSLPVRAVDSVAENLSTRSRLVNENQGLRSENLLLRSRSQKFAALESENARLRALLDSSGELGEEVVVADILAIETRSAMRQIVINKGSRQHVYVGQPIADAHGIVGQVFDVSTFSSSVILITDSRHSIPVRINRNGLRAIATGGENEDELILSYIPNNADIRVGDLVVSSGLDHRFPAGYPVGEVEHVDTTPSESFARISVKPSAHIGRAREVLLVWPRRLMNQLPPLPSP
ncbi:MAG: rod shape-determining protein MreC [Gammaproteobacteria bacterium]|nr:rod shape-determining protein MreC [Gammaproteobacteria bacterium]